MIQKRLPPSMSRRKGKPREVKKTSASPAPIPHESNGKSPKESAVISLLQTWLSDESGYDEAAWPALKKALDLERKRQGARRLFDG